MKVYVLVNQYMMGIQAGIQALHAVSDMWRHKDVTAKRELETRLMTWELDHKTVILLNGGGMRELNAYSYHIEDKLTDHFGVAMEDAGLNYAITAVAFLADPEHPKYDELMDLIKDLPLKN